MKPLIKALEVLTLCNRDWSNANVCFSVSVEQGILLDFVLGNKRIGCRK